jgi:glycosyltransferase involved in cell wall biosynthesis
LVKELKLESDVLFFPPTQLINQHYVSASLFVMSSRGEGLPMVLIEAKTFGLPIVSFACQTGPADIICDGSDGFLVPPEDVTALKERLLFIFQNEKKRQEMAVHARKDSERFLSNEIMKSWEKLLNQVNGSTFI